MKQIFILILIIAFALTGCSKKSADMNFKKSSSTEETISTSDDGKSNQPEISKKTESKEQVQRQLIKTGTIEYTVEDFSCIEKIVNAKVKEAGGYIFSNESSLNNLKIQVKIPFDKFDDFVSLTGSFGKIDSKIISVNDVTMNYYDLEGRIKTKKILRDRFQSYLASAKNIEDLMKIERELNNVTEEIESVEGEFKNLSYMIAYSTLTMNFYVIGKSNPERSLPSLVTAFKDFGYNLAYFFIVLLKIILYIIGFGLPIIIIIALFYYATFGKLGLVKKLFVQLSGKNR